MSGGSLMKLGTESNWSSGADVDCAKAEEQSRLNIMESQGFMKTSLTRRRCARNSRLPVSIQTDQLATQLRCAGLQARAGGGQWPCEWGELPRSARCWPSAWPMRGRIRL